MNLKNLISKYWPLLIVLIVGGSIRLYGLLQNPISLFADEVDIGYQAQSFIATGRDYQGNFIPLQFHSFSDVRTSLPIYATILVSFIPGVSLDLAIRLTPAIFSVLGILLIYLLTNNLFKLFDLDTKIKIFEPGFWSALVLSLMPWHFTYSRIGFELSMLFTFFVAGMYFYTLYLKSKKTFLLVLSLVILSLTPMIYSTAKFAILLYPLILMLIPGSIWVFWKQKAVLYFVILFIPLGLLFLNGGSGKRFSEVSIFTDPTVSTQINFLRNEDLGPVAKVGSETNPLSKLAHNKAVDVSKMFLNNIINPISFSYLFLQGDTNERHAVQGWGMLEKTLMIPLLFGFYKLASKKKKIFILFLLSLTFAAILPASLTRDGFNHSSRNFMLIIPLVLLCGYGFAGIFSSSKWLAGLIVGFLLFESFLYLHNYWYHYRYSSERAWNAGIKEVVESQKKYPGQAIIISPKYENPLIFYAYYTKMDPRRFQQFIKSNTLYNKLSGQFNLDGNRIGDTNLYIATPVDYKNTSQSSISNAIYYLTKLETENSEILSVAFINSIIRLPSGKILYYEIHY